MQSTKARSSDDEAAAEKRDARTIWHDFRGLKKLWPDLRSQKRLIFFAILLIPVISALQMSLPLILRYAVDEGIIGNEKEALWLGAGLYLAVIVAEYMTRAGQSLATSIAVHRMIRRLRDRLVNHVLKLKCAFHDRSMSGALVTRATSDFDNLSESLNMGVLTSIVDLTVLAGCVTGMFLLNWQLALCTLVILPLVALIVRDFSIRLKKTMLIARRKIATLNAYTQESLYGHTTIKLLAAEGHVQKKYDVLNISYRDAQMKSVFLDAMMFSILDGIASISIGVVLWVAVSHFGGSSLLSAGVIVAFVQYIQQLFEPLKHLGNKMAMLQGAFTSIDRIFGILENREFVEGCETHFTITGKIEFTDVSFAYRGGKSTNVLNHVSFTLKKGESLALVGATGSGKSTIIKLIAKLYDGYEGSIKIDDYELQSLSARELRQQVAIVPQDIVLFDGSIRFNISLGIPGITEEDVTDAAKQIGAASFIEKLPGGYDFKIKEDGKNLSHGQRQLIAFARAVARSPKLVILDEATSSVDSQSEAVIQDAIAEILRNRSVIVIAHRLSTVRRCHQILVLDGGRVVESGVHESLLAEKGAYFQLHQALT